MFDLIGTLIRGSNARATERAEDYFALDLIQQKIRDAETGLNAAKNTLATLVVRQKRENEALERLSSQRTDLELRATEALKAEQTTLAHQAATAIAELENEEKLRKDTLNRLDDRIARMRLSIDKAHKRIVDLRQGATTAQTMDMERRAQKRLNQSIGNTTSIDEVERLIARVVDMDDPLEQSEILDEINADLNHTNIADTLAANGFGPKTKSSAEDVLARLSQS